jgi:hypothetical protein
MHDALFSHSSLATTQPRLHNNKAAAFNAHPSCEITLLRDREIPAFASSVEKRFVREVSTRKIGSVCSLEI